MIYILILFIAICLFLIIKPYFIKYDTIIAFTGGLGSGKTYLSVKYSIKLLKRNRLKVWWYNNVKRYIKKVFRINKRLAPRLEKPLLYSSIPVRISRKEWSVVLTEKHLLLVDKIREKSVVFIDEIGSFATQFDYKIPNIADNFNEFIRLFRHYTKGGYLVVNDQCSENIVLEVRRRINTVFNVMRFRIWFKVLYTCKCRNISISEEIKTIEENNTEDNMRLLIGLPFFRKKYDTYCYSERYSTTLQNEEKQYKRLKKNVLMSTPKTKYEKKILNEDEFLL